MVIFVVEIEAPMKKGHKQLAAGMAVDMLAVVEIAVVFEVELVMKKGHKGFVGVLVESEVVVEVMAVDNRHLWVGVFADSPHFEALFGKVVVAVVVVEVADSLH